ncbi:rhodanese-like domain-containing protein [Granulicella arctica]|uniref:rhodanese-like domain-containing protein n=1 Tax=Granulicella arctica TaxID=940613 RepID=UPI0021E0D58F|nr:rhodanese-like domain-containing protein [Granulicella arctica]
MLIWIVVGAVVGALVYGAIWWRRREQGRLLLAKHSIEAEELHGILAGESRPRLYDVRQPLDLLAYSEIIPGSERISPKDIRANPSLIPMDVDAVVYCTCPDDETAREIVNKALALSFTRVRILRGGLAAWKAGGYPVERYTTAFHLDTPV